MTSSLKNIAVFASGGGSNLQALIDAAKSGSLPARICAVISNNANSGALVRAKNEGIPSYHLQNPGTPEEVTLAALAENSADILFLSGYLRKIGPAVRSAYTGQMYNVHPSLLPKYGGKGMYGIHVHRAVIAAGEKETGVTIHRVDAEYDTGGIVAQTVVPVYPDDTPEVLQARVLDVEHLFIVDVLRDLIYR